MELGVKQGRKRDTRQVTKQRGVFEKVPGSGVWWVRFMDADGKLRREKAGTKSNAISLYQKRKLEVLTGKKLPEKLRARVVKFRELAQDARKHVKSTNEGHQSDTYRIDRLNEIFGNFPAVIPIESLREWFDDQEWEAGTYNRARTVLSLIYRLGMENKKVDCNPAKLLKHKRENDGRVRFLNQFSPDEETRLREAVTVKYPDHMPELDIALNTGMRRSEQYLRIDWNCVDFFRRDLYIPQSKNGSSRHIPLNTHAVSAFQEMFARTKGKGPIFAAKRGGERLLGPRHWFEEAVETAKLVGFTWHDLRHTFASRLVMAGVDLRTVAELLGHKKIQMTMRYAHLAPQHKMAAVEKLNSFSPLSLGSPAGLQKRRRSVTLKPVSATGTN
jgi:integrase